MEGVEGLTNKALRCMVLAFKDMLMLSAARCPEIILAHGIHWPTLNSLYMCKIVACACRIEKINSLPVMLFQMPTYA